MGFFDWGEAESARETIYSGRHEGELSHELLAAAAGFEALREYEKRQERSGEPVKHALAKEILMGIAAAEVEKLIETKGLDYLDAEKAKHHAKQQAARLYDSQYDS